MLISLRALVKAEAGLASWSSARRLYTLNSVPPDGIDPVASRSKSFAGSVLVLESSLLILHLGSHRLGTIRFVGLTLTLFYALAANPVAGLASVRHGRPSWRRHRGSSGFGPSGGVHSTKQTLVGPWSSTALAKHRPMTMTTYFPCRHPFGFYFLPALAEAPLSYLTDCGRGTAPYVFPSRR